MVTEAGEKARDMAAMANPVTRMPEHFQTARIAVVIKQTDYNSVYTELIMC